MDSALDGRPIDFVSAGWLVIAFSAALVVVGTILLVAWHSRKERRRSER